MHHTKFLLLILVILLQSCSLKKDILYFQDASEHNIEEISLKNYKIEPNDILNITVSTPVPEAAIPYNIQSLGNNGSFNIESLKLQGYLVSEENLIDFPILEKISTSGLTIKELEAKIKRLLEEGDHLKNVSINIRLINAKVTVLGEVNLPGTFTFTEKTISLPQALGYAGDLTITGKRNDVMLIREENGIRTMNKINLTRSDWFNSPFYYIKPNDIIVVNPNRAKIKSAGFIGNAGVVLTIASLILSSIVLISR